MWRAKRSPGCTFTLDWRVVLGITAKCWRHIVQMPPPDVLQGHLLIAWDEAAPSQLHTCAAAGRLSSSSFLQQRAVRCYSAARCP
jgi:hypothetical protein